MTSRFALFAAFFLVFSRPGSAATPDDQYVQIYALIEEADKLNDAGQSRLAATRYSEAQTALKDLRQMFPGWNSKIVAYRMEYVASKLEALSQKGAIVQTPARGPAIALVSDQTITNQLLLLRQEIARLSDQNALLTAQLKEALSAQPASLDPRELTKAEEKIAQLQKEKDLLIVSFEQARTKAAPPQSSQPEKIKQLERELASAQASLRASLAERDELAKKLDVTTRSGAANANGASDPKAQEFKQQLEIARAKLAVYEARQVPFTMDELALLKQAPIKVAATVTNSPAIKKKPRDLPSGAGPLLTEAERAIDAGRYEEAERRFRDILRQDETNVRILARLAAAQLDQDKIAEAEGTLKKALVSDPEDAASLYLLGSLKLRQEKYDEALDALSLSAKLDPEMAQTQYFLGKALVHKGNRAAAETALRKAIQLKPGWGEPHYLLAVIYGTQEPTYQELAHFHYKKAIAGGATRNTELEEWIEKGRPSAKK